MKKSQLVEIVKEELNKVGYSKYKAGGKTTGSDADFSEILWNLVHGKDLETRVSDSLAKADPENVARISRGEKPIYKEGEGDLYSKEDAIQYIENNLGAKYYRIGVGKGVQQTSNTPNQAIQIIQSSPINQFELSTYGEVVSFSAPYDEKHADLVRSMGSLD